MKNYFDIYLLELELLQKELKKLKIVTPLIISSLAKKHNIPKHYLNKIIRTYKDKYL